MFKTRRRRFEKLLALRQRELDQKQAESSRALKAQRESRLALEQAQDGLKTAANGWRGEVGEIRTASHYMEASSWLQHQVQAVEAALNTHELSNERVRLTGIAVQKAEQGKRQIETLIERLDRERALHTLRQEQAEQDELASRLALAQRVPPR